LVGIVKPYLIWKLFSGKQGWKKKTGNQREDNSFSWLIIRNVRIILIKIMDKAKHVNTFWVI